MNQKHRLSFALARFTVVRHDLWLNPSVRKFILVRAKQSQRGIVIQIQDIVPTEAIDAGVSEILIGLLAQ